MRCACIAFSLEHCQAGCQYLPATYIFMITAKACGFVCVHVFTTILCFWSIYGWGIITTTTLTPLCLHFVCEFIQAPSLRPFHFFVCFFFFFMQAPSLQSFHVFGLSGWGIMSTLCMSDLSVEELAKCSPICILLHLLIMIKILQTWWPVCSFNSLCLCPV